MRKKILVDGKETNYEISDMGEVFNLKTNRQLKGTYARNEYHSVQLTIEGKPKSFMTHRLVAMHLFLIQTIIYLLTILIEINMTIEQKIFVG